MRIADRRQRLGRPRLGWISTKKSKRNKHNNTVRKMRHEAFLNSNFYWDWIKNTQEIRQWKSLNLDQLSYAEHSWEHFGLPKVLSQYQFQFAFVHLLHLPIWSKSTFPVTVHTPKSVTYCGLTCLPKSCNYSPFGCKCLLHSLNIYNL